MTKIADRIRRLRKKIGKTDVDMASLLGMSVDSYCDLETHDDELTTVPTIQQVKLLSDILGVSTINILVRNNSSTNPITNISYEELVTKTKEYIVANCANQLEFEDRVGWCLNDFFAGQDNAWNNYPIEFLQDLCGILNINWLETLPI